MSTSSATNCSQVIVVDINLYSDATPRPHYVHTMLIDKRLDRYRVTSEAVRNFLVGKYLIKNEKTPFCFTNPRII